MTKTTTIPAFTGRPRVLLKVQAKCGHWDTFEAWLMPGDEHRAEIPNGYSDFCKMCWAKQDARFEEDPA